jgi:hypothetical protein
MVSPIVCAVLYVQSPALAIASMMAGEGAGCRAQGAGCRGPCDGLMVRCSGVRGSGLWVEVSSGLGLTYGCRAHEIQNVLGWRIAGVTTH